ncbi:MAG: hypothetical protein CVT98_00455 [Bacteroidetes bacterium HGW-Bacteroidetes-15]|nr:MAG: hypothetical protein CVT98_00455 [Bacteroidetes bacterium HGW-Bacteroidetes-15]
MRILTALLVGLLFTACAVLKGPTLVELKPTTTNQFLETPFGHIESIDAFKQNMPVGTKVQKLIKRAPRSHHKPDTIYNYLYKKSKISVYKTQFNQEFVLGGIIINPGIEFSNGIRQGMEKSKFFKSFTDMENTGRDTIVIKHPKIDRTFNFYFNKKERLEKVTFTGHNPQNQN